MQTRGRRSGAYSGGKGEFEKAVAERVKELRGQRGWRKTELAKRWEKSLPVVTQLEKGEGPVARLDTLAELAQVFDMSLGEFIWPIVEPKNAIELEAGARVTFSRDLYLAYEKLRERYLKVLEKEQAIKLLHDVNMIAAGYPQHLLLALSMVSFVSLQARMDEMDAGNAWAQPVTLTDFDFHDLDD